MNGEQVFYRRERLKGWRGPAKVIGQEGKIVLLRHATAYYRCHPCQLMKMKMATERTPTAEMRKSTIKSPAIVNRAAANYDDDDDDEDQHTRNGVAYDSRTEDNVNGVEDAGCIEGNGNEVEDASRREDKVNEVEDDDHFDSVNPDRGENVTDSFSDNDSHQLREEEATDGDQIPAEADGTEKLERPIPKMHIEYLCKDGSAGKATVLSRQPKKQSKWNNWLNVQPEGLRGPIGINWNDVVYWKELPQPYETVFH